MWAETTSDDANIRAGQPGDEIGDDTAPCRTVLVLAGLPPWFIGDRVQDGVPSAETVRPTFLVAPFTAIRNVRVRRRTSGNSYSRSSVVHRAKIVVDVGVGFLRRSRSRTVLASPETRDWRRYGTSPLHTSPRLFATPLV